MRPQEFLASVRDRAAAALRGESRALRARIVYASLQMHFGNPRVHYEVWLVRQTGRIEIGLHFEGEREENARAAEALAAWVHELRAGAGDDVELEQWTTSWTRLHVTLPLGPLTDDLCDKVADRLARLIAVTWPLLRDTPPPAPPRRGEENIARGSRTRTARSFP